MQRMLVALVLVLIVVVAALGITVINLNTKVNEQGAARQTATGPRSDPAEEVGESPRVRELTVRLANLRGDFERLRKWQAVASKPARSGQDGGSGAGTGENASPGRPGSSALDTGSDRPRDSEGGYLITEDDESYFMAVQRRVQRRQRIDGATRNAMRRIDRLVTRGDIGTLGAEQRASVQAVVRRFTIAGDDMMTRYVRSPSQEIRAMSAEDRRTQVREERDAIVQQAAQELAPLVGEADALKVAETSLSNPWGFRRRGGDRGNESRARRGR